MHKGIGLHNSFVTCHPVSYEKEIELQERLHDLFYLWNAKVKVIIWL